MSDWWSPSFWIENNIVIWFAGIAFAAVLFAVFYFLYFKPREQEPLPNERSLGHLTIWLKEHGVQSGSACTAKRTFMELLSSVFEHETDEDKRKLISETKKLLDKFSLVAHRVDRKVQVYLFNKNPEDQEYLAVDTRYRDGRILNGVQDVHGAGEWDGMEFYAVRLGSEPTLFSDEERKIVEVVSEGVKYLREAAKNTQKIAGMREENKDLKGSLDKTLKEKAEYRSKLDRALSALSQKLLSTEGVEVKTGLIPKLKQWFTLPQCLTALIGYFIVVPVLIQVANLDLQPPATTYFAAVVTVICFFIIPLGKRVFSRWL